MPDLDFPFWLILSPRRDDGAPPSEADEPAIALAFSTTTLVSEFLQRRRQGRWEIRLVTRSTISVAVADLHSLGIETILLDPPAEGPGGRIVSLTELWTLATD